MMPLPQQPPHRLAANQRLLPLQLLAFLLLTPSAISSGRFKSKMISKGTLPSFSASMARIKKAHPCFCSTAQKIQHRNNLLRTRCTPGDRRAFAATANDVDDTTPPSFYQRLNSPKHILAPMVAQSDLPFRLMCEQLYNVDLSYTQMIHAYNFIEPNGEIFRTNHLDVYPRSTVRDILLGTEDRNTLLVSPSQNYALKGLSDNEIEQSRTRILASISKSKGSDELIIPEVKPTVVQIAAHDPDVAVEAALMILERSGSQALYKNEAIPPVAAIDLNLGCPQSIARKGRYGSFLHDESPEDTYKVLTELRSKLPKEIGVTAKIRLPPTQSDADAGKLGNISRLRNGPQTIDDRMRCLIDCGIDLITVHGRTRFENKVAVGPANWDAVQQCVQTARDYSGDANFPVFANGGIEFGEDVQKCLETTNASGVMSSESLLELPGIFRSGEGDTASSTTARGLLERQLGYADTYLDYASLLPPLPGSLGTKGGSFNVIRTHMFKFLHRYLEEHHDLRSWLGNQELNTIKQARDLVSDLRSRYSNIDEEQLRLQNSWNTSASWYRRHRKQKSQPQHESSQTLTVEERKKLAKLRIRKMQAERMKKSVKAV